MHEMRWASVLAIVLSVAAAVVCHELLDTHLTGSSGSAWFEAGCSQTDEKGGSNCTAVLASPYSYWPPKKENEPEGTLHVPVAFVGLIYYSALAVWFLGVGIPSPDRRRLHLLPLGLVAVGLLGSAYFTFILFTKLDEWCPWCLVTHLLNVGVAICTAFMWPRSAHPDAPDRGPLPEEEAGLAPSRGEPYPSRRLTWVTIMAVAFIVYAEDQMLGRKRYYQAAVAAVKRLTGDIETVMRNWNDSTQFAISIRPDDPFRLRRRDAQNPLVAVVYSDFQCPSCRVVAGFLQTRVEPLFDGYLKTVFKHYPLDSDCNPATTSQKHEHACAAAKIAEAARVLGGEDAFWRAHDFLFENQKRLTNGKLTPDEVATHLGLDPGRLRDMMMSQSVADRISEDALQARSNRVNGTPALFVARRRVSPALMKNLRFWDRIADQYWISRGEPRPLQ